MAAALVLSVVSAISPLSRTEGAAAETGNDFQAGYIISDANFFDYASMSQADIQSFLDSKVSRCVGANGFPCLESYTETTTSRAAVGANHCSAYQGAANESAAAIIYKVAQACRISPKVLIVLLQKEQGLVTATSPTSLQYRSATGYGCPDTAACDSRYYGFYNQVYDAAWQFRQYTFAPNRTYKIGNLPIAFSPNSSCGSSVVNIQNQATANLYNYTPYQPNPAALANLSGTGNSCSSYGNRNFWKYFWDWFGDPTGNSNPFGVIDSISGAPGAIIVKGWVIDPDTSDPVTVHVYVDNVLTSAAPASASRPDLAAVFPDKGGNHGIDLTLSGLSIGQHQVCLYAINLLFGGNAFMGCSNVAVPTGSPFGVIDSLSATPGALTVSGWALDPDTASPISVRVYLDGALATTVTADQVKSGLSSAFPGYGDNHLYGATVSGVSGGAHTVCIQPVNSGPGVDGTKICRTSVIPTGPPVGVIDTATSAPGTISISGWMLDPDTVGPISMQFTVDGVAAGTALANGVKAGLDQSFPGYGDNHLFTQTFSGLGTGSHKVCAIGVNVGSGQNAAVCRTVAMPTGTPLGVIDSTASLPGVISFTGWMIDWDTISPVSVKVLVDNQYRSTVVADANKSGLGLSFPGYGDSHGFTGSVDGLSPGKHQLCVIGVNVGGGSDTAPQCVMVQMPTGAPFGAVDSASGGSGSFSVSGWAIDPDVAAPITVSVRIDNVAAGTLTADQAKSGLGLVFPGYGDNHLFQGSFPVTAGTHEVCVYGLNVASADADGFLGCQTVSAS